MSWDVVVKFPGILTEEEEDRLFRLLNIEFYRVHVEEAHNGKSRVHDHGLSFIPRSRFPGMAEAIILAPCHWDMDHTQETEVDIHRAADLLEIRVLTYQSGNAHVTEWADRDVVLKSEQVFHY